ncbi:putative deacylase [Bradyrhizobium sp. JR1.5]|uniref:succinylglutamate desuccinylase/aspartoacylase family protein n=1 Tax=unclassified Bradyrhizobium TaxID=2631580 RepID=UPI0024468DF6|nr:succinylglutamate desuccinylase/aspartoacylase family protein [Bradyrhizobium sp. SSUT18]MDH2399130.1 succinylglutamate desuccinylase/aspartoacylase family protein [Bradyrhizobium sp. SSUT18]
MNQSFELSIDLDKDGRQDGYLNVKTTSELSPFGCSMVPITSIRNGDGPCVVVIGGCHGDEYEGQLIARSLLGTVEVEDVRGQLIMLPAANAEAVRAGRRFAPSDDGNLNAVFPGRESGTATERIAHFIETVLMSRAELVVDIHTGGRSIDYFPSAMLSGAIDGDRRRRVVDLTKALGLPVAFFVDEEDYTPSSILGACDRAGVLNISAEIGGGGSVNLSTLEQARTGVIRLLHRAGVLCDGPSNSAPEVAFMRRLPISSTVFSPASGLLEPLVQLGDWVTKDQLAGLLHSIETPWSKPTPVYFAEAGFVLCRRLPVATQIGDGVFKLAVPMKA